MRRPSAFVLFGIAGAMLAACADTTPSRHEDIATALPTPLPAERALGPETPADGELADARALLDTYDDAAVARRRPDLLAVADAAFACWDSAGDEPLISGETVACREDFWSAMDALRSADRRAPTFAANP